MIRFSPPVSKLLWVSLFGIAFAFVESSVVVYLRALYYPEGFSFPLKLMVPTHLFVEIAREAATIAMLATVGILSGAKRWERFAYFIFAFGVWDIFYYMWLKLILGWPPSVLDWDILFLIPLPWIGPVIAPLLISILMIGFGVSIVLLFESGREFRPSLLAWLFAVLGTVVMLYSFVLDTKATLGGENPVSYHYELLAVGLGFYVLSFVSAWKASLQSTRTE